MNKGPYDKNIVYVNEAFLKYTQSHAVKMIFDSN